MVDPADGHASMVAAGPSVKPNRAAPDELPQEGLSLGSPTPQGRGALLL